MAEKTTTAQQDLKKKKKKWITILASPEFGDQEIGETLVEESEQALGRVVEVNLMMLTRDPKKQNFNLYFKIDEVKNNQASTKLVSYNIQVAQLKKITRKSKNKLDDSFVYKSKDNENITIKPIFITKALTYKTSLKSIRKLSREFLQEYCKRGSTQQILKEIISGNLQRDLKAAVKKVTPVVNCIIKTATLN